MGPQSPRKCSNFEILAKIEGKEANFFFENLPRECKDLILVKKKFKIISCLCTFNAAPPTTYTARDFSTTNIDIFKHTIRAITWPSTSATNLHLLTRYNYYLSLLCQLGGGGRKDAVRIYYLMFQCGQVKGQMTRRCCFCYSVEGCAIRIGLEPGLHPPIKI